LRDGFALTSAGAYADFATVALGVLEGLLSHAGGPKEGPRPAAEHVLAGLPDLELHPDVAQGMRRLRDAGVRLITLTNGAAELTATVLRRGGVADLVERMMSVSEVGRWKPAAAPYLHAAQQSGVPPDEMALIAVHPWDIDGAKRAGLRAGWLNRAASPYPGHFERPDAVGGDLTALGEALLG
jgi:2-haloacid dehalogenase